MYAKKMVVLSVSTLMLATTFVSPVVGLSTGEALASALDISGNGWIGLYVREMWNDSQTVFYGTQHKTM